MLVPQKRQNRLITSCMAILFLTWAMPGDAIRRGNGLTSSSRTLLVRYAALSDDLIYMGNKLLPQLASSICQVEQFLSPALTVRYMIYTSSFSQPGLEKMINKVFPEISGRVQFLNLDEDPDDKARMAAYEGLQLDKVNVASIRRMLADAVHLPSSQERLLLGNDISFLKRPDDFLQKLSQKQVLYMMDLETFHGHPYEVAAYHGPQCKGLLGDFIYLPSGMQISQEDAQQALKFYMNQPLSPPRLNPPCEACDRNTSVYWAMDQYAWAMLLGKASDGACVALDSTKYHHMSREGFEHLEAIHDKEIRCPSKASLARSSLSPVHNLLSRLKATLFPVARDSRQEPVL